MSPTVQHVTLTNRRSTSARSMGINSSNNNAMTSVGTDKEVTGNGNNATTNPNHNNTLTTNRKHKPAVTHIKYRRNGSLGRGLNKLGFTMTNSSSSGHNSDHNLNPDELKRCKSSDAILLRNTALRRSKSYIKNGGSSEFSIANKRRPVAAKKILQLHASDDDNDDEYEDLENDDNTGLNEISKDNFQEDSEVNSPVMDADTSSNISKREPINSTDNSHVMQHTNQNDKDRDSKVLTNQVNLPTIDQVQAVNNNVTGRDTQLTSQKPVTTLHQQSTPMTTALRNKMATNLSQQHNPVSSISPLRSFESPSSSSSSQSSISPHQAKHTNNNTNVRHSNSTAQIHRPTKSTVPATRTQQKLWLQRESIVIDHPSNNYTTTPTDGSTPPFAANNGSTNFHTSYSQVSLCNPEHKREFERINREFIGLRAISNPILETVERYAKLNKSIRNPKRDSINGLQGDFSRSTRSGNQGLTINTDHDGYDQRHGLSQSVPRHAFESDASLNNTSNRTRNEKPVINSNTAINGYNAAAVDRGFQNFIRNKVISDTVDVNEVLLRLWNSGWKTAQRELLKEPLANNNGNSATANGTGNNGNSTTANGGTANDSGSNNEVPALRLRAQQIQRQMAIAAQHQENQQLQQQRQPKENGSGNESVKPSG
ncbi:hypothetical protein NADFUDRAFT_80212 [Nadsonia fulvescens var. elongata DSM 6958]|uniref:Uncharacterized protein n=1 Tax=Nadsonia fulvescens var. elongata DSM 6958 TaxID=857566 RepID=A0A1E3PF92_9ASCO|nr:hypothetical protein NADFUDRAFT_80212 [Nadsonia fulvescens var. elongata DSM 6958]